MVTQRVMELVQGRHLIKYETILPSSRIDSSPLFSVTSDVRVRCKAEIRIWKRRCAEVLCFLEERDAIPQEGSLGQSQATR